MKKLLLSLSLALTALPSIAQDDESTSSEPPRKRRGYVPPSSFIIGISPIHVTDENIGLGLGMELFTGKKGIVSISLPFSVALPPDDYNNRWYEDYSHSGYDASFEQFNVRREMVYFYPGIKVYPTGAFKRVSYAVGMNLVAGVGRAEQYTRTYKVSSYNNGNYYYYNERELISENVANLSRYKIGAMVTNSLNLRPSNHFYMGVEFGIGYTYVNKLASRTENRSALVQLGVKFGLAN